MAWGSFGVGCCCGGGGGGLAMCGCSGVPTTLHLTSSDHTIDGAMFQDATLVYGATPAGYGGLPMATNTFLSTASFVDANGDSFRYFLYCNPGTPDQWFLTRVYLHSIFGSPYEDTVRYTWNLSSPNTCSPFSLATGRVYAGGGTVTVTVTA